MAKEKMTIEEYLKHRKVKQPNKFIWWFLNKLVVKPFLERKYHPTYHIIDDINKEEGPCFIVYNHSSRSDFIYLTQAAYPKRMNFVTGYNEFFRSKFKLIFKLLGQIPKKNFAQDMLCMKGMREVIKDNGCVCFSPEGMSSITGHNQPVVPGTGKLFKHYKIPVYVLQLRGGFLTNHKVCLDDRPGKMDCTFKKLFTVEDIDRLSVEELDLELDKALWSDDYEWNKTARVEFKTKGRACTHMHDLCYRCPKCGEEFKMIGENNYLKCTACGNGAYMDDFYDFKPFDETCVIPESPSKWVDEERVQVIKDIRKDDNYSISVNVKLGELPKYKYLKDPNTSVITGEGLVTVDHSGLTFKGTRSGSPFEFHMNYELLYTYCIVTDCTYFGTYYNGEYFEFIPDKPVVGKFLLVTEEMHRLHVNKWKNFPWMDYMYEGLDK